MYELELNKYAKDILESDNFQSTKEHIQHGNMTVEEHCINVAKTSLYIKEKLNIKCNTRDLVRGALLHDYFLYDWHVEDKEHPHKLHGFYHPGRALENARKEYVVTKIQADIISKHMWPLTLVPPMCVEAWIVTMADKYCSTLETLHVHNGHVQYRHGHKGMSVLTKM
jgi:uncharacterized protein